MNTGHRERLLKYLNEMLNRLLPGEWEFDGLEIQLSPHRYAGLSLRGFKTNLKTGEKGYFEVPFNELYIPIRMGKESRIERMHWEEDPIEQFFQEAGKVCIEAKEHGFDTMVVLRTPEGLLNTSEFYKDKDAKRICHRFPEVASCYTKFVDMMLLLRDSFIEAFEKRGV